MCYDSARDRIVLFGGIAGIAGSTPHADTWEYDGASWRQLQPAHSPPKRLQQAMCYDPVRKVIVLFGGWDEFSHSGNARWLNDTWEWNGQDWAEIVTSTRPVGRNTGAMAYDASQNVTILFGGSIAPIETFANDTWKYDGTRWTKIVTATTPHVRGSHAVFYDQTRRTICTQGGITRANFRTFWTDPAVWSLDLARSTWVKLSSTVEHPLCGFHRVIPGRARGPVYSFGGLVVGDADTDQLRSWSGGTWTIATKTGAWPSARVEHAMAYDSLRDRFLMFGGLALDHPTYPSNNETWELTEPRIQITIDIKPGSDPNSINLSSQGVIPVAILSTAAFSATQVDPETVSLGGAGVAVRGKGSRFLASASDVNQDGLVDLVLHVVIENLDPARLTNGLAILTGETYTHQLVRGEDTISIVKR